MSTFDSTKPLLTDLLSKAVKGKLQLPDLEKAPADTSALVADDDEGDEEEGEAA